jgi:hypothetical protein
MGLHKLRNSSTLNAILTVAAVALCVVLPFFRLGIPSGHDFEFHFNSWIEVLEHWKQGILYPHWAAMAHYRYGEARFIFYPPTSWMMGAALGAVLPWKLVSGAYIWVALTLSGCSMFLLARRWLRPSDAIFAAAVYVANPYHLVIIYWRSAMAELLAAAYLPLLLLLVLRLDSDSGRNSNQHRSRVVVPLSLLVAAGWLTNLPAAVMMNYSLALLAVSVAIRRRSLAVLAYAGAGAAIGAALAAFYLVPAFHEQSWVNIAEVLSPGVRPQDNFLFTTTTDVDHNRFNLLASIVAIWEIAVLSTTLFFSRRLLKERLWWLMLAWGLVSTLLMWRPTILLWAHLPELQFVQLPWRWLLCLNVPLALATASALRRWWLRGLVCAAAIGVLLLVWHRVQLPWWDSGGDIQEMVDNQHDGLGSEGTDEYVPAGADPDEVDQKAPLAAFEGPGKAKIQVQEWREDSRVLVATASRPGKVVLRLFNYPSWHTRVNGHTVEAETSMPIGQLVVPVAAGENRIQIAFVQGSDRKIGVVISVCALMVIVVWLLVSRKAAHSASA